MMQDVPEQLTISHDTFRYLLASMLIAIGDLEDGRSYRLGSSADLSEALEAALRGDREQVLREVADVLAPPTLDKQ